MSCIALIYGFPIRHWRHDKAVAVGLPSPTTTALAVTCCSFASCWHFGHICAAPPATRICVIEVLILPPCVYSFPQSLPQPLQQLCFIFVQAQRLWQDDFSSCNLDLLVWLIVLLFFFGLSSLQSASRVRHSLDILLLCPSYIQRCPPIYGELSLDVVEEETHDDHQRRSPYNEAYEVPPHGRDGWLCGSKYSRRAARRMNGTSQQHHSRCACAPYRASYPLDLLIL